MKLLYCRLFTLLIFTSLFASEAQRFNILDKDNNKVTISFLNEDVLTEKSNNYDHFIGYESLTIEEGLPELPKYTLNYGLNPNKDYVISYNIVESHIIDDIDIFPYQPLNHENSEFF